jgi:hypothetical protein
MDDHEDAATRARLWREARTSIAWGFLILVCCAAGLGMFVLSMPKLKVSLGRSRRGGMQSAGCSGRKENRRRQACSAAAGVAVSNPLR